MSAVPIVMPNGRSADIQSQVLTRGEPNQEVRTDR